jgi:tetratricopeptide (TPR) repeat protein
MSEIHGSDVGVDTQSYTRLRDLATQQTRDGLLDQARSGFAAALAIAERSGSAALVDRAFCNLAGVEIELGGAPETMPASLRQILVENRDSECCRLAAYHLSRYYELRKQGKKALFYARIAKERSRLLDHSYWIGSSGNQVAMLLLSECRLDEASRELEVALAHLPEDEGVAKALVMENLAYCRFLQGQMSEGFRLAFQSLRRLRKLGRRWWHPELTLTYGYLQINRGARALRHGRAALASAEGAGEVQAIKNALFLLGEAANQVGDTDAAYDYFARLQRDHYPDQPFLPSFLLAVDVTGLVNLKA